MFKATVSAYLLSVSQIARCGYEVRFNIQGVKVINPVGDVIATDTPDVSNGLFRFDECDNQSLRSAPVNLDVWNRRMAQKWEISFGGSWYDVACTGSGVYLFIS